MIVLSSSAPQLEYKILLVSTAKHNAVLAVGEWLKLASAPLQWCHIYAPVVPQRLAIELLQCPAPYLLGIERASLQDLQHHLQQRARTGGGDTGDSASASMLRALISGSTAASSRDVLVVADLDSNAVFGPAAFEALLPVGWKLVNDLTQTLQPHLSHCDEVGIDASVQQETSTKLAYVVILNIFLSNAYLIFTF